MTGASSPLVALSKCKHSDDELDLALPQRRENAWDGIWLNLSTASNQLINVAGPSGSNFDPAQAPRVRIESDISRLSSMSFSDVELFAVPSNVSLTVGPALEGLVMLSNVTLRCPGAGDARIRFRNVTLDNSSAPSVTKQRRSHNHQMSNTTL